MKVMRMTKIQKKKNAESARKTRKRKKIYLELLEKKVIFKEIFTLIFNIVC